MYCIAQLCAEYFATGHHQARKRHSKIRIFCFLTTAVTSLFKQNRSILEIVLKKPVGIYRFRVQSGCKISVNEAKIQMVPADPFKTLTIILRIPSQLLIDNLFQRSGGRIFLTKTRRNAIINLTTTQTAQDHVPAKDHGCRSKGAPKAYSCLR